MHTVPPPPTGFRLVFRDGGFLRFETLESAARYARKEGWVKRDPLEVKISL